MRTINCHVRVPPNARRRLKILQRPALILSPKPQRLTLLSFYQGSPKRRQLHPSLSCLKPTELLKEYIYVDVVRAASQKPDKRTPPAMRVALVGPHGRAVNASIYCSDDPVVCRCHRKIPLSQLFNPQRECF